MNATWYDILRFLHRGSTFGMLVVIFLEISGKLSYGLGTIDVAVLFAIALGTRITLNRWKPR